MLPGPSGHAHAPVVVRAARTLAPSRPFPSHFPTSRTYFYATQMIAKVVSFITKHCREVPLLILPRDYLDNLARRL